MSTNQVLGAVLIVIGLLAFWYQGVARLRTRDRVVEAGSTSTQVSTERPRSVPVAPLIGSIAIIAGVVLLTR